MAHEAVPPRQPGLSQVPMSHLDGLDLARWSAGAQVARSQGLASCPEKGARDGSPSAGEAVTVHKAIQAFEADAKTTIKPSTLKQYKIILGKLNTFAKDKG